ncbi:endonuclease/exonuclease/phosphatase family protein [Acidisoma silvae]|uniref:Endonuclease/exonuclease/phosphatase family protein n=1 Tax=Acidisoma silvae TaxID=2802396 RepID=A0A963YTR1_9PROT|nr:endonuclease/exonuclease/phosphatase family protein [Acidisoma silvae]MCB8876868.1 endonuclease/exonuclease/phosphatase family protein [Acidisoma silvae]
MRILSWNLLHTGGATLGDVLGLIERQRPDLLLLQEATAAIDGLAKIGGTYHRSLMPGRANGLAAWSAQGFRLLDTLNLPPGLAWDLRPLRSRPGRSRIALVLEFQAIQIANVHLDHGQRSNRRQLRHIAETYPGIGLIMGDFNAVGAARPHGFSDIGPRRITHMARGVVPFRLDRCLSRTLVPMTATALPYGPSDHRPIVIDFPPCADPAIVKDLALGVSS